MFPLRDTVDVVASFFGHPDQEVIMKMYAQIVAATSALSVVGIFLSVWPLITAATLAACGTLLFALLRYFEELPA